MTKLDTICLLIFSFILLTGLPPMVPHRKMTGLAGLADKPHRYGREAKSDGAAHLERINIFSADGKDPRIALNRTSVAGRALAPIEMIENNSPVPVRSGPASIGKTTAFLISPCFALTNRHAVYGEDDSRDTNKDRSVTIYFGVGDKNGLRWKARAEVIKAGYIRTGQSEDWALLQIANCVGRGIGWMELGSDNPFEKTLLMAGHPEDKSSEKLPIQTACKVHGVDAFAGLLLHDCSSRPGASGSPIFMMVDRGPRVVAIHSAGGRTESPGSCESGRRPMRTVRWELIS